MRWFDDQESRPVRHAELLFSGVIHWDHAVGPSHCLGRLFDGPAGLVGIVSKVRTSEWDRGPGGVEMPAVATAFVDALPKTLQVVPSRIVWLAHYGDFSTWDGHGGPEEFLEVTLDWGDGQFQPFVDLDRAYTGMRQPEPAEVTELLLGGLALEDPLSVLERLGEVTS